MSGSRPVDVISVCSADGTIRPLRFQMEDEERQLLRINIQEVISVREIEHVGGGRQVSSSVGPKFTTGTGNSS